MASQSHQTLLDQLSILRMSAFRNALETQLASPEYEELSFTDRLSLLVDTEVHQRNENRFKRRIRQAGFQQTAFVQDIDYSVERGLQRQQILQLAQSIWIQKALNLMIYGPTGAGKSYIACALGRAACELDLKVRYFRLPRFFQEIKMAQVEGTYSRVIRSLAKIDLLILDDWLRDHISISEAQSLLDILDDRYGVTSVMLATQVPVALWHARIPDPTLADAILDRVVHNAHRIELQGDSQRKLRVDSSLAKP